MVRSILVVWSWIRKFGRGCSAHFQEMAKDFSVACRQEPLVYVAPKPRRPMRPRESHIDDLVSATMECAEVSISFAQAMLDKWYKSEQASLITHKSNSGYDRLAAKLDDEYKRNKERLDKILEDWRKC